MPPVSPPDSWQPGPSHPSLGPGVVQVWRASLLADEGSLPGLLAVLSEEERVRSERFRSERHRRRYVVGRAVQRRLLARYLGCPPQSVVYRNGPHGKPALDAAAHCRALRFNVSNSEDGLLLAVTEGVEIGVDLEALRPVTERDAIAARFFSPPEQVVFGSLAEAERDAAFYTCWTRKEAYLKALGEGLSAPLHSFDVTLRPGEPARLLQTRGDPAEAARWTLRELDPGPGWFAALALEGPLRRLELYDWEPGSFPPGLP